MVLLFPIDFCMFIHSVYLEIIHHCFMARCQKLFLLAKNLTKNVYYTQ